VLNVVTGDGGIVGRALAESPIVDKISLTGGTDTGKAILRSIGSSHIKKITFELGGKSPNIFFADADLEAATDGALFGVFVNQGEVCTAGSRVLVQQDIFKKFMDRMKEKTKRIKLGDPLKRETKMGPLVTKEHQQKVLSYIDIGRKEAKLVMGGGRPRAQGLLHRTHDLRDRQHHAHRPGRNLRPGRGLHSLQGRSRRAEDRQRHTVRPRRRGVVARHLQVPARRQESPRRHRVGQHHATVLRRVPVGRLQSQRPGPRDVPHGIEEFLETKQVHINLNEAPIGWY
jgi:betaine-aldehyde dehydrogenase